MSEELFKENRLRLIAKQDVDALQKAHNSYGNSWRKRGGVGAFMMLARKWDRLENALRPMLYPASGSMAANIHETVPPWDIFKAMEVDRRPEGIIDDIRDLRRYLLLVESEMAPAAELPKDTQDLARGGPVTPGVPCIVGEAAQGQPDHRYTNQDGKKE